MLPLDSNKRGTESAAGLKPAERGSGGHRALSLLRVLINAERGEKRRFHGKKGVRVTFIGKIFKIKEKKVGLLRTNYGGAGG